MKTMRFAAAAAALAAVAVAPSARAADSTRGPWYVDVSPAGFGLLTTCLNNQIVVNNGIPSSPTNTVCGTGSAYRADIEGGYHFSKRHDGFTLGIRQVLYVAGGVAGSSLVRFGYDIAVPIKDFELTIAPFVNAGVAYNMVTDGAVVFAFAGGIDVKFFITKAFYLFARPAELGAWIPGGFVYQAGIGAGLAF